MKKELLKELPQVSKLVERYRDKYPEVYIKSAARKVLESFRKEILEGRRTHILDLYEILEEQIIKECLTNLRRVVNATGVIINTNLGRSVLSEEVAEFIKTIATSYCNLEYDLEEGRRGSRQRIVEDYLTELTGAESAMVVNNNASAVFLILNTHAKGREVIVSRGELVEIGGSFRIPDIMRESGALLVEVGTTNRSRLSDYQKAINERTALILKVHRSNFYMEGFVEEVPVEELLTLGLPVYYDAGSGMLLRLTSEEPSFEDCIKKGVQIVSGSGDKLLGGPQAGIIVGKRELVEPLKKNPLSRVLRIDKLTLAGLEYTLRLYKEGRHLEIPTIRMLFESLENLKKKAKKLAKSLKSIPNLEVFIVKDVSKPGGGALPRLELQTYCVGLRHKNYTPSKIHELFRKADPPVIGRLEEDMFLIDVRTLLDEDYKIIPKVAMEIFAS